MYQMHDCGTYEQRIELFSPLCVALSHDDEFCSRFHTASAESGPSISANFHDPNVQWMRDNREIFAFVDGVGRYGSGWWLVTA